MPRPPLSLLPVALLVCRSAMARLAADTQRRAAQAKRKAADQANNKKKKKKCPWWFPTCDLIA